MKRAVIRASSCCLPILTFEPAHTGAGTGRQSSAGTACRTRGSETGQLASGGVPVKTVLPDGSGRRAAGEGSECRAYQSNQPLSRRPWPPLAWHTGPRRVNAAATGYYLPQPADPRLLEHLLTTNPEDFAANARRAESILTSAMDTWKNGLDSVTNQFRAFPSVGNLPQLDATEAVERQFAFITQVVELNPQYARQLAEVAHTLTAATRQQIESVSGAVRDQLGSVTEATRGNVDKLEQTVRDTAEQTERTQREAREQAEAAQRQQASDAAQAERQERKQAQDQARERYQSLTKTELSDEAGKRDLPKTGTVDELVERLVADDTK